MADVLCQPEFLPISRAECRLLGWDQLDVILVSGDAYIDSPFSGVALVGRWLVAHGYRVGILSQPDPNDLRAALALGEPRLFWGVSAGCVDSMVANYTAAGKPRRQDDFTPGGCNDRRPDRASIQYANMIRRASKSGIPIVLGGIEASLRRLAHYDYWNNRVRQSVLADAKADYLIYGMAEQSVLELARTLESGGNPCWINGLCWRDSRCPDDARILPGWEQVRQDRQAYLQAFEAFRSRMDGRRGTRLAQEQAPGVWVVQNPPAPAPDEGTLDAVHELPFRRQVHPAERSRGEVRAQQTIAFSVVTHRGCYGECAFCAIAVHQGRLVQSRSMNSIEREVRQLTALPEFRGQITDLGGPTANMYGYECQRKQRSGACSHRSCIGSEGVCPELPVDHGPQIELLARLRRMSGVRGIRVASGVRYDLILADRRRGEAWLRELMCHHMGGQLRIAPEHLSDPVLRAMGKPPLRDLEAFRALFGRVQKQLGVRGFLSYYLIAAHPGCEVQHMQELCDYARQVLRVSLRDVQLFTPTPGTLATTMYWTGVDPRTGEIVAVERSARGRQLQKDMAVVRRGESRSGSAGAGRRRRR